LLASATLLALAALPSRADDQATGLMRVNASVQHAVVYIDNQEVGQTPYTAYLPPGDHTVRVVADQFDPFVRRVTVAPSRTVDVTADLLPGDGTVEFFVDPAGAELIVNDKDHYPTPIRLRNLSPGHYQWLLQAPGREDATGDFDFTAGKNLLIVQSLTSSAGRMAITSKPAGAEVFLDGSRAGVTPLALHDIPPGIHQVLLDLHDHAAVLRTVDTRDGSKGVVDARLSEGGASLIVKTPSPDAEVSLNDVRVGAGRRVRLPALERGRYTLAVTAPGRATASTRIEVPDHGSVHWQAKLHDGNSELAAYTPLSESWVFWAGAAAVAGGATAGGIVAYNAGVPDPIPPGDVLVVLP